MHLEGSWDDFCFESEKRDSAWHSTLAQHLSKGTKEGSKSKLAKITTAAAL